MDFPKKQQQCLIPRYLLQYLTSLQTNHDDPTAPWGGGGGGSYTAGDGIEISDEDVISVDDTVALKSDIPSLTGYATETWVTNQGYLVQSDLSDYVTSSELITELGNYVTSTDLATELLNYAELDDIPTKTSDLTNDSGFITSSALTGYATETWVTNQGYSTFSGSYNDLTNKPDLSIYETKAEAFSGDYNDLTNKPTIPVVPTNISAFTNDSGYITSSALRDYVKTNTTQNITGVKTFIGRKMIKFKQLYSTDKLGFTGYDNNNSELGYLEMNKSDNDFGNKTTNVLGIYDNSNTASDKYVGFKYYKNKGSDNNKHVVEIFVPPLYANTNSGLQYIRYIPIDFTDGTNIVRSDSAGIVNISSLLPTIPTKTSDLTNDSDYITSSALTGYATESWVTNQGYLTSVSWNDILSKPTFATVATSGSYNDLTDKPTIPDAVSGTNDGTNWTSLTIGSDTYGLASGSTPANMVTTDTDQDIDGVKTFTGQLKLKFKQSSSGDILGFTAYDNNNNQLGNLQIADRNFGGTPDIYTTLGNYSLNSTKSKVGFRLQPNGNINSFNFVMPYGTYSDFYNSGYRVNTDTTIPCAFTDGTYTINANAAGVVDLSYLNLGGSSYTAGIGIKITNDVISVDSTVVALKRDIPTVPTNVSAFINDAGYVTSSSLATVATSGSYNDLSNKPSIPDAVSGTNDGTNWTSLTIGNDTYGIPSGGGSAGPTVTRYTGYASHPITYAVPSGQSQYSHMYIRIYSSELSGFLNYDNVNPGDILYINTTLGYKRSDGNYYRYSKLFTVSVPPKPDSTYPIYTISTDDPADGNISGMWACSTVNRMTNTQETTASNIVKRTADGLDATDNFYIRVPLWSYSNLTITLTVDSITHIAF